MNGLWGAAGAFCYGINALIFAWWSAGHTRDGRSKAMAEFLAGVVTGVVAAEGFTSTLQRITSERAHVELDAVVVALSIGWVSNDVWPRLLKRLGKRLDQPATKAPPP